VVCDWFLKYAGRQAIGLAEAGVDATLLCRTHAFEFGNSEAERSSLLAEVRARGVRILEIERRFASVRALPSIVRTWRAVNSWQPDIVHAHTNYDPRLFAVTRRYPSIFEVHDPRPDRRQTPEITGARSAVRRAWTRRANRVVVHGERLRGELEESVTSDRIAVLPHGLEPEKAPVSPPERPTVLLFGRLEPYKGVEVLLRAMEVVWTHRPEVILRIAGRGSVEDRITADPRVDAILGYVPEGRVNELLDDASLVVLPYLVGSQSGVGSLALARGIPTVVSDVGSLADLAFDDSFVVPPGDPERLAAALLRHLDHDASLRAAVLERARARFSWSAIAKESIKLYKEVLNGDGA
jgi:glycosyltransferase involved in cell wall biosynthesis